MKWFLEKVVLAVFVLILAAMVVGIAASPFYIRHGWIDYQDWRESYQKSFETFRQNHETLIELVKSDMDETQQDTFSSLILDQYQELQRIKRLKDWKEGSAEYMACSYYTEMLIQLRTSVQLNERPDRALTFIEMPFNWVVSQQ